MNDGIVEQLRSRSCPAGLAWTSDDPKSDHGHTDCWLNHQAADEIERLRTSGNLLEEQLMKLHRNHHGPDCETCKAFITWWETTGR